MGELVSKMSCCLCGNPHYGNELTEGWFANGISPKRRRAEKLLCPQCL